MRVGVIWKISNAAGQSDCPAAFFIPLHEMVCMLLFQRTVGVRRRGGVSLRILPKHVLSPWPQDRSRLACGQDESTCF